MDYLTDKGWDAPISCIEYLGKFYVLDGKKRTSVLKAHGASTAKAIVTKVLPVMSEDKDVQLYAEFLRSYELTGLYQVSFSLVGSFEKLQAALGYEADHVWTEGDRFGFLFNLVTVEHALQEAFGGYLKVTAADALLVLLEDHSYNQVRKMHPWVMTKLLQDSWKKLYKICNPDFAITPSGVA